MSRDRDHRPANPRDRSGTSVPRLPTGSVRVQQPRSSLDEVEKPRTLIRPAPGFRSAELSRYFDTDFEGVTGVTRDVQLVHQIPDPDQIPSPTFQIDSTDAVQTFTAPQLLVGDQLATSALISCRADNISFAIDSDPDQTSAGYLLVPGEKIILTGINILAAFRFISAAAGVPGVLNVTMRI